MEVLSRAGKSYDTISLHIACGWLCVAKASAVSLIFEFRKNSTAATPNSVET